jgi:hypothetical protein
MVSSFWIGCSAMAAAILVVMRVSLLADASLLAVASLLADASRLADVSRLAVASLLAVVMTAAAMRGAPRAAVGSASRVTCSVA